MSSNITIDISYEVLNMNISDKWDLLQVLWSNIKQEGQEIDWESFKEDNDIADVEDYKTIKDESLKFAALDSVGVDNWCGWDEAMQLYREWKEK